MWALQTHASCINIALKGCWGFIFFVMNNKLSVCFTTMYLTEGREIAEADLSMCVKIAGISNYVTIDHVGEMAGVFPGYVENEPANPVDSNAIAIYTDRDEKVGYVPKSEIKRVSEFSEDERMPCFLQILPFIDEYGELGMKGKAILLKLYEGKIDVMQNFMDTLSSELIKDTDRQIADFHKLLDNKIDNKENIGLGKAMEHEFDFSIYSYAVAPILEKSSNMEDNIVEFEIKDINRYIDIVFVDPEEKGIFAGFELNGEIFNNDGFLVGHVPQEDLSKVDVLARGRKLFCLYSIMDSLTQNNQRCLASKAIAFKLFDEDDNFNYSLLGKFGMMFIEVCTIFTKDISKKIAKLTQYGEELGFSNEYYEHKKRAR